MNRVLRLTAYVCCLSLVACGGGGSGNVRPDPEPPAATPEPPAPSPTTPVTSSDPAYHLATARFTTHQPDVLEQIGAHHAYAKGLSGRGVKIGIDDTIVDFTQISEFGTRVKLLDSDGARLSYSHPFGDQIFSDVDNCRRNPTCSVWTGDSQGDDEALNRWVRQVVDQDGWPTRDDSVFILDEHYSEHDPLESLFRWTEVPTPYREGIHGTVVASTASGKNLGVAPGATIVPIAQNLSDDQRADALAGTALRLVIAALPTSERESIDNLLADAQRNEYQNFDIINRSYGRALFDPDVVSSAIASEVRWYSQFLPRTFDAILQADRPASEKAILVYAAGNDGEAYSGLGADLPYYIPELRGHSLAVVATDPQTGRIADYSNRCGSVPADWSVARHGPHYCLAAPGTVQGLVPNPNSPGSGDVVDGLSGTSFAAPVVSGALALLMEHFRGTRGNTAIVKRMLDTADRSGRYAVLETYGAGHLDMESALSPVGALSAGQSARALSHTALQTPDAFGSVAQRAGNVELAAFDEQDFPFWVPLPALVSTRAGSRSPIPELETVVTPATGLEALGLNWMPLGEVATLWQPDDQEWAAGFGPTSASVARRPRDGGWGFGFGYDHSGFLESHTSGAFGSDLRSGMMWASRALQHKLGDGWMFDTTGTLAVSLPYYENDAIFQASPSVLSALSMRVGTDHTALTIEQPLRAESGTGTFRIENGWMESGRKLHDVYRVPLRPDAREVRVTLRHERETLDGNFAIEVGSAVNAGHVSGEHEVNIGFAYRMIW